MAWFILTGSDPYNADHYTLSTSSPRCYGGNGVCAIQANNDGNDRPALTPALQEEIAAILARRHSSITVILRD